MKFGCDCMLIDHKLYTRLSELKGKSSTKHKKTNITDHIKICDSGFTLEILQITASKGKRNSLQIEESVFIRINRPLISEGDSY